MRPGRLASGRASNLPLGSLPRFCEKKACALRPRVGLRSAAISPLGIPSRSQVLVAPERSARAARLLLYRLLHGIEDSTQRHQSASGARCGNANRASVPGRARALSRASRTSSVAKPVISAVPRCRLLSHARTVTTTAAAGAWTFVRRAGANGRHSPTNYRAARFALPHRADAD